jgi:hypothetical protein
VASGPRGRDGPPKVVLSSSCRPIRQHHKQPGLCFLFLGRRSCTSSFGRPGEEHCKAKARARENRCWFMSAIFIIPSPFRSIESNCGSTTDALGVMMTDWSIDPVAYYVTLVSFSIDPQLLPGPIMPAQFIFLCRNNQVHACKPRTIWPQATISYVRTTYLY